MPLERICQIEGCGNPIYCRKWCSAHYERWRAHGDPNAGGTSPGLPKKFLYETALNYRGDNCLKWPFADNGVGYGVININHKMQLVHRVVCEIVHGLPPSKTHQAAHSCGKGHEGCCAPLHLSWKTRAENRHDTIRHGTHKFGENHVWAKLTQQNVRAIRALAATKSQQALADQFGVSRILVRHIINRKQWAWLLD